MPKKEPENTDQLPWYQDWVKSIHAAAKGQAPVEPAVEHENAPTDG